jgi:hypothetical protein
VLAIVTHPVPAAHGIAAAHAVPGVPPSAPGRQLTAAMVPSQPKSHFMPVPQVCAAGSQPTTPVSTGASPPDPASAPTAPFFPPHAADRIDTAAANTSAAFLSPLTAQDYIAGASTFGYPRTSMSRFSQAPAAKRSWFTGGTMLATLAEAMFQPTTQTSRLAGAVVVLLASWSAGCGKNGTAKPNNGDGSVTTPDAPVTGMRSFDVVAVLRTDGASLLSPTNKFTLILDADGRRAIVGGNGRAEVVPLAASGSGRFTSATPFSVGDDKADPCSVPEDVRYDSFDVTVNGGSLTGTAIGAGTVSCGDCAFQVSFAATLTGTTDTTPPTLRPSGAQPANPFDPASLVASEPLPASATARLVADDGAVIDLVPQMVVKDDISIIISFSKPDVVLRAGQGYVVPLDGLVDFAGLSDRVGPPLRLTSFLDAPTVPEDGFESASGTTLGGAMVMTAGALPAIAGNTSLYIGGKGAPALDAAGGRSLMVRLAKQAGDSKLRFSYRVVSLQSGASFYGALRVGSEGASPGPAVYSIGDATTPRETLTVAGQTVYASTAAVMEQPLPADATGEVLVVVAPSSSACFFGPVMNIGLLIDDLRLE